MVKAKFGASVRSKSDTPQVNEVLCQILPYSICVLIQSFYELGIEIDFTTPASRDSKIVYLDNYRRDLGPARLWMRLALGLCCGRGSVGNNDSLVSHGRGYWK